MSIDAEDPGGGRAGGIGAKARRAPSRWAFWLLRGFVTVLALDAFLQAVFAGRFLSGDYGMLALHRDNATYVGLLGLVQIVVAILAWRLSRVPGRVVAAAIVVALLVVVQIAIGFARFMGIHVPLGVAIVAGYGWLTGWLWTHRPGPPVPTGQAPVPTGQAPATGGQSPISTGQST